MLAFERPTEACQAVGVESWGYRAEEDYYTDAHLVRSIDRMMARGANYLLNVGPKPDGTLPERAVRMLRTIGDWYHRVEEALVEVEPCSDLIVNREVLLTRRGNTLYVHLVTPPRTNAVILAPLAKLPRTATLLNTGEPVQTRLDRLPERFRDPGPSLRLYDLPVNEHAGTALVVKLEFDEDPA